MARVCILVMNNCTVDSRILREAKTFTKHGHETIIVATHVGDVPAVEQRDGFEIRRVPVHYTWADGYPRLSKIVPLHLFDRARERHAARQAEAVAAREQAASTPTAAPTTAPSGAGAPARKPSLPALLVRRTKRVARARTRRAVRNAKRFYLRSKRDARRFMIRKGMLPTRYRQLDRRMATYAAEFNADLYWANDTQTVRAARAAARKTGARWVYDAHEVIWDAPTVKPLNRRLWGWVERVHTKRADRVSTVCEPIADVMMKRYRIPRPTVIMNCPLMSDIASAIVDPASSPLNAYRAPGEKLILFHGSLSAWRGLEQMVEALQHLPEDHRLVILGHGTFRKTLEQLVEEHGVTGRVTFIESVPPDVLPAWLAGADVGTIPYQRHGRNHEYSTPNKLFEYMHIGTPIIANDLPEIRRIVNDVGFGIITDCSDPLAIAKAIQEITSDPARARAMRDAALAAAPRYSWEGQEHLVLAALGPGAG